MALCVKDGEFNELAVSFSPSRGATPPGRKQSGGGARGSSLRGRAARAFPARFLISLIRASVVYD